MSGLRLVKTVIVKHNLDGIQTLKQSLHLLDHMKKYGSVTMFKFLRDPVTQERSGLAFVSYQNYSDAEQATITSTQTVDGLSERFNTISVSKYRPKEQL